MASPPPPPFTYLLFSSLRRDMLSHSFALNLGLQMSYTVQSQLSKHHSFEIPYYLNRDNPCHVPLNFSWRCASDKIKEENHSGLEECL